MLKSFNSLLIDKVQCVSSENILPEFFSSPLYVHEFFLGRWSCARIFFLCICTCRIFFSKCPPPLPSEVKWSAPNTFIIQHIDNKTKFEEKILSTSFLFLNSLVKMLKVTSIVGYTIVGWTYVHREFFDHIWGGGWARPTVNGTCARMVLHGNVSTHSTLLAVNLAHLVLVETTYRYNNDKQTT